MASTRLHAPFKNRSFAFKLTSLFLLVFIGVFSVATIILGLKWYDSLARGLSARGVLTSNNAAAEINDLVNQAETVGLIYANKINTADGTLPDGDLEEIKGMLNGKDDESAISQHISSIGIILENTDPNEIKPYRFYYQPAQQKATDQQAVRDFVPLDEDWFVEAGNETKPFWHHSASLLLRSPLANLYITPLTDRKTKRFIGALVVEVPMEAFRNIMDKALVENEGICFLFNGKGAPIASSRKAMDMPLEEQERFSRQHREHTRKKINYGYIDTVAPWNGGAHVFYSTSGNGWEISFALPGNWVYDRLYTMFHYIFAIFIITVPLVVLVTYLLTKRVISPLTRLTKAAEAIGGGQFNVSLPKYTGNDEISQLTRSFEQMQRELSVYLEELRKSFQQQEHIESEINIAKTIQMGILPKVETALIEAEPFDLEAILIPAKGVGGDLYDFFFLDESHLVAIVGDVSGKGIPGALFMSVTQTLQRSIAFRFKEPEEIARQLNKVLMINNEACMFVTYFISIIDTCSGKMTYCNAGHNFPFLRRANGNLEVLDRQHGLPLGVDEGEYLSDTIMLHPEDTLILYTDGITEAFNPHGELFGDTRLKEAISYAMTADPHKIAHTILEHMEIFIEGHEQSDDITLLSLQMKNSFCPVSAADASHVPDGGQTQVNLAKYPEITLHDDMKGGKSDLFNMTFSNGEEGLFLAMSTAEQACLEQGIGASKIFLVNLCMEELVTNALRYGSAGRPAIHFNISLQYNPDGLSLTIRDDANPFNPLTEAPPPDLETDIEDRKLGGLGIHLLKNMTASMTYEYRNKQNIIFIKIE